MTASSVALLLLCTKPVLVHLVLVLLDILLKLLINDLLTNNFGNIAREDRGRTSGP